MAGKQRKDFKLPKSVSVFALAWPVTNINHTKKGSSMKTTSGKLTSGAILALCLTWSGSLPAAESLYDIKPPTEHTTVSDNKCADDTSAKFNKASGIIGMDVRNHNDERLGKIKDVVFDLRSERVAYAVLGTGGLFERQKLLAVPLSAFTASEDNKYLVLRAEKSKLETATGIDRDNWPSVTNPSWGAEPFWDDPSRLDDFFNDELDKNYDLIPKKEIKPEEKKSDDKQEYKPDYK